MQYHQTTNQRKGSAPSEISRTRQFHRPRIQPESGEEKITATGRHNIQYALARARSARGNQLESRTRVAGQTPPSATPSRRRITQNSREVPTSPVAAEQTPQITSRTLTKRLALQRCAR